MIHSKLTKTADREHHERTCAMAFIDTLDSKDVCNLHRTEDIFRELKGLPRWDFVAYRTDIEIWLAIEIKCLVDQKIQRPISDGNYPFRTSSKGTVA